MKGICCDTRGVNCSLLNSQEYQHVQFHSFKHFPCNYIVLAWDIENNIFNMFNIFNWDL